MVSRVVALMLCLFINLCAFEDRAFAYRQDYSPEDAPLYEICRPDGSCEDVKLSFLVVDPHWYVYSFSNGVTWMLSLAGC